MQQNKNSTENSYVTLNDINAIVLVADKNGKIIFVNEATKEILGYEPSELLGDGWWNLTHSNLDSSKRKSATISLAKGELNIKDRHLFENAITSKKGDIVWTQWTNTINSQGNLVGIAQDITQKKALEEELNKKNKENQLLLREIHHRVKNNLQIINSMLNLQFNAIDDPRVREALSKSKDRIHSMALIHEKIYVSNNMEALNFNDYLEDLANTIRRSYDFENKIKLVVKTTPAIFDIDLAINLGLITTELLTNAYKHAFTHNLDNRDGTILVELKKQNTNTHILIIEDNGIGIDSSSIEEQSNSFGLEIVNALTDQINGKLITESNVGLKYVLQFEL